MASQVVAAAAAVVEYARRSHHRPRLLVSSCSVAMGSWFWS
jgi:hypothetical protein